MTDAPRVETEEDIVLDPQGIYELDETVAAQLGTAAQGGTGPVLVHVLDGFVDAGSAGEIVAEHLLDQLTSTRLVTFDVDQLLAYRSRRPVMTFDDDRWVSYDEPVLVIDVVHDTEGTPFLLLHGMEPDLQWERFSRAVRDVVERFGVSLTVGVHGIPMGVPHTRPISATAHGTRNELLDIQPHVFGRVQVPSSASSLLELRLGEAGHDAMGFAVHVPHYLAQARFAPAARAGLEHLQRVTGLALDVAAIDAAADETMASVAEQVEGSEEVANVVRLLENQYDSFARSVGRTNLLADSAPIPSGDEIAAHFEEFLAQQDETD